MIQSLISEAIEWGHSRGLHYSPSLNGQFTKLVEELGELAGGIARNDEEKILDAVGDMLVVLCQFGAIHSRLTSCCQRNEYLAMCLGKAMSEIRNRTGYIRDGIFIKTEPNEEEM